MTEKEKSKESQTERPLAVVTGASSGIGEAFASVLAGENYNLLIVARSVDRLNQVADKIRKENGVQVEVWGADLTNEADLKKLEAKVVEDQRLDLLVNNAGFGTNGLFSKLDIEKEAEEIKLNVLALVRLTGAALPAMISRKRGAIINVSSMAAFQPAPFNATYGATKAFVNNFTESIHEELRGTGVKVQALCPGFTRTGFQKRAGIDPSNIPSIAWMTPEEVVRESLCALRRGTLICVPGFGNKVLTMASQAIPRSINRRLSRIAIKRFSNE